MLILSYLSTEWVFAAERRRRNYGGKNFIWSKKKCQIIKKTKDDRPWFADPPGFTSNWYFKRQVYQILKCIWLYKWEKIAKSYWSIYDGRIPASWSTNRPFERCLDSHLLDNNSRHSSHGWIKKKYIINVFLSLCYWVLKFLKKFCVRQCY